MTANWRRYKLLLSFNQGVEEFVKTLDEAGSHEYRAPALPGGVVKPYRCSEVISLPATFQQLLKLYCLNTRYILRVFLEHSSNIRTK